MNSNLTADEHPHPHPPKNTQRSDDVIVTSSDIKTLPRRQNQVSTMWFMVIWKAKGDALLTLYAIDFTIFM